MATRHNEVLQLPTQQTPRSGAKKVPKRSRNLDYRSREYLTESEVEKLMVAARNVGRHGHRDATLILLGYRHGLRVTELVNLRWEQIDLGQGLIHVNRLKRGTASVHPLAGIEQNALIRLQREYSKMPYVFVSERKSPLTPDAIRKIMGRAGIKSQLPFTVHPHMLRHACGFPPFSRTLS